MYSKEELCRLEQSELVKLIDEGQLVYMPCKIGDDTVFKICKLCNGEKIIVSGTIRNYRSCLQTEFYFTEPTRALNVWLPAERIGKTVFFTAEEAEKALKESEAKTQ